MKNAQNTTASPPAESPNSSTALPPAALIVALLGGLYFVACPLQNQFSPYTGEAAFAGLAMILFGLALGAGYLLSKPAPDAAFSQSLLAALLAFCGLFVWGLLRSPYYGGALPAATMVLSYVFCVALGWLATRLDSRLRPMLTRAIVAMVTVEAVAALWQIYVELPRLRQQLETGVMTMPENLASSIGLARLYGNEAFVTFGNPNSLAAYLLMGFLLHLGQAWKALRALASRVLQGTGTGTGSSVPLVWSVFHVLVALVILSALFWTGSKGGTLALLCGMWIFAVQRIDRPLLTRLTFAGFAGLCLLLILGATGVLPSRWFGASLQVRFEYWKSAWAMFARHPFDGVGLAGFEEWATVFKTPLGGEVKNPHNGYLELLCELGVLGPLLYGLLWWLLLRRRDFDRPAAAPALPRGAAASSTWRGSRLPEALCIIGGALALLVAIANFDVFNSADVVNLIRGEVSKESALASAQTLLLPFVFALVAIGLRASSESVVAEASSDDARIQWHAYRAAAAAILLHQLVDFDFQAQAVMTVLFFLGGAFVTSEPRARRTAAAFEIPGWAVALAVMTAAVAFVPAALLTPWAVGNARQEVDDLEHREGEVLAHPDQHPGELTQEQFDRAILDARLSVTKLLPYDAEALKDYELARAYRGKFADDAEIAEGLRQALALRPLSPQISSLLGGLYFQRAFRARERQNVSGEKENFKQAAAAFHRAVELYPLHPGLWLTEGDAFLLGGDAPSACARYLEAFAVDVRIADPNVYLSSIFDDPRPGVFVRHAYNTAVLQDLSKLLITAAGPAAKDTQTRLGLLCRRMVGLARVIHESEVKGVANAQAAGHAQELLRELRFTVDEMREIPGGIAQRAHAALLYAECLKKTPPLEDGPEALKKEQAEALENARQLQEQSVAQGSPGTVPTLFPLLAYPKQVSK